MKALLVILVTAASSLAAQQTSPSPFLVHEWGTFTSMQGADGIALEGLHHEEEPLPDFVHDLANLDAAVGGGRGAGVLKFPARSVTQKMETPVIYFHTDVQRRVSVDVTFVHGLLTQFYPVPDVIQAPLEPNWRTVDLGKVEQSTAMWNLDLIPFGEAAPAEIPPVAADQPWSFARQVRAAYVRGVEEPGIERALEAEHYVFYRGLGAFTLPVAVRAEAGGRAIFGNDTAHAIPFGVAMQMTQDGGRFQVLGSVGAAARAQIELGALPLRDTDLVARQVGAVVLRALLDAGLFLDEARAMVATWARQWFRSPGTRVIYLLPRAEVDRVLPLTIRPEPDAMVRVLVGRLEYVTPEVQARVEGALRDSRAGDAGARAAADRVLRDLDRFLEPHLRLAAAKAGDEVVRAIATEMLGTVAR